MGNSEFEFDESSRGRFWLAARSPVPTALWNRTRQILLVESLRQHHGRITDGSK